MPSFKLSVTVVLHTCNLVESRQWSKAERRFRFGRLLRSSYQWRKLPICGWFTVGSAGNIRPGAITGSASPSKPCGLFDAIEKNFHRAAGADISNPKKPREFFQG